MLGPMPTPYAVLRSGDGATNRQFGASAPLSGSTRRRGRWPRDQRQPTPRPRLPYKCQRASTPPTPPLFSYDIGTFQQGQLLSSAGPVKRPRREFPPKPIMEPDVAATIRSGGDV